MRGFVLGFCVSFSFFAGEGKGGGFSARPGSCWWEEALVSLFLFFFLSLLLGRVTDGGERREEEG